MDPLRNRTLDPWEPGTHELIASLDPLKADSLLRSLPRINQAADVNALVNMMTTLAPSVPQAQAMAPLNAVASLRDLGMLLGSIRRHKVQPLEAAPSLTPVLLGLGARAAMPPRDILLHYTVWNPPGTRRRTYTAFEEEEALISCVCRSIPPVERAVAFAMQLREEPIASMPFGQTATQICKEVAELVKVVVFTHLNVDPGVFIREIRPYFDSIVIDGIEHRGPGAVETPVYLLDHILWSASLGDPMLEEFKEKYVPHLLPHLNRYYQTCKNQPTIVDRVEQELIEHPGDSAVVVQNLKQLNELFRTIIRFRAPHMGLAYQAYDEENGGNYDHGSGGYEPVALMPILQRTREAQARIQALLGDRAESQQDLSLGSIERLVPGQVNAHKLAETSLSGLKAVERLASSSQNGRPQSAELRSSVIAKKI